MLTPREVEIVRMLARGECSKDIARELNLSHKTVECHRHNAAHKLGTRGLLQMAIAALKSGLITLEEFTA
jgi:two-component system nitrate/nitrite response regulator NarL